ncbi:MAG: prepilin-type N-terminal cleavage/methylation domain-containing protein [Pseudomonadota bacterium]
MKHFHHEVNSDRQGRRPFQTRRQPSLRPAGFTLIELMIAVAIVAVIAVIAIPSYRQYVDRADNAQAGVDLNTLSPRLELFFIDKNRYPGSLAEINMDGMRDPWGNPYQYLLILGGGFRTQLNARKDNNLVPINSDYDLYSMGKDGSSSVPLTAPNSLDDVVRANNGRYVGTAKDY